MSFGRHLLRHGALTQVELNEFAHVMVVFGGRLGTVLVEAGRFSMEEVEDHLAADLAMPRVPPDRLDPPMASCRHARVRGRLRPGRLRSTRSWGFERSRPGRKSAMPSGGSTLLSPRRSRRFRWIPSRHPRRPGLPLSDASLAALDSLCGTAAEAYERLILEMKRLHS